MTQHTDQEETKKPDLKVRTAAAATAMNILLTGLKFLLFFFSGSLAILAEAVHSFTDIATSFLVFVAVKRSGAPPPEEEDEEVPDESDPETEAPKRKPKKDNLELKISLCIGLLLAVLAATLLRKCIVAEVVEVKNALVSGIMFLVFSIGSYFIYRFETRVGEQEGSIGLVSDGMHARADMTASLLTGFSLILYSMGINLDRWVAGLIALFILSFAVETLVNVGLVYFRRESDYLFKYKSFKIIAFLFDKTAIQNALKILRAFLEARLENAGLRKALYRAIIFGPFVLLCAGYLSTAFFSVGVREQAVVERFGRPLDLQEPLGPGLHVKWPWPVDRVRKVDTASIKQINIGNITDKQTKALLWTRTHGAEEAFLSGDNNFFYPYIVLHYRIDNIFDFLYSTNDPDVLISEVAHRVATSLFAGEAFYTIAATHRNDLKQRLFERLQAELDGLQSGVELLAANFKDIHPPIFVADAFERVIAGYQEKQKIINDALGYCNNVLPQSRGTAASRLEAAQAYITDRVKTAHGESVRFRLSLPESRQQKNLAMSRIYLQTVRDVLKEKSNIVVDPGSGEPELWIDFDNVFPADWKGGQKK